MAEIQSADQNNGQLTQRFIEFVMMQAQQAALCLGKMPHPINGETAVNLPAAQMFIDHLELLREKTRGNLNKEEGDILNGIITELQVTFIQVSKEAENEAPKKDVPIEASIEDDKKTPKVEANSSSSSDSSLVGEQENKKKFSKSYGE